MKVMVSFVALLFTSAISNAAAPGSADVISAKACGARNVAECGLLARTPLNAAGSRALGFPRSTDGTVIFNPLAALKNANPDNLISDLSQNAELAAMSAATPAHAERALRVAERTRTAAIELFDASAGSPSRDAERTVIRNRLSNVVIAIASDEDTRCAKEVPLGFPAAIYDAAIHTVLLCPALSRSNPEAIVRAIAHELGHVASPCYTMQSLFEVDPAKANPSALTSCDSGLMIEGEGEGGVSDVPKLQPLRRLVRGEVRFLVANEANPVFRTLMNCGMIRPVQNSATRTREIVGTTQDCIERLNRTRYTEEIAAISNSIEEIEKVSHASATAKAKTIVPEQCQGRTLEHFADAFSARVVGRVAQKEKWSANATRSAFVEYVGYNCHGLGGYQDEYSYPPFATRLQITMNDPQLASRLRCEASPSHSQLCPLEISLGATAVNTAPRGTTSVPTRSTTAPGRGTR
ncbi:MAG: hypothetical protein V4760_03150 [Bdellovibrionota bacterium]